MEYIVVASVIALGYSLSKSPEKNLAKLKDTPHNKNPSGNDIYQSRYSQKVEEHVKKLSQKMYDDIKNPNSNVVVPGNSNNFLPNNKVNNSVSHINYESPIKDIDTTRPEHIHVKKIDTNTGGWHGLSLTGNPINPNNFKHNNMVPFFGGTIKQNVDEKATRTQFENFTGSQENYRKKKEVKSFYDVKNNISNPYGMQSLDGFQKDRYHVSNKRANEAPVEQIRVGPGLNKGYNSNPSGGFQQANTRDYVLPKHVDQLRVKTNPKNSYGGRIIPGKKPSKTGKVGVVMKNRPDTFYVNNPDRYFTTTGAVKGPVQRPNILIKPTNRKETNKFHVGPATNVEGSRNRKRTNKYKKSTKEEWGGYGWRNIEALGEWIGSAFDYGKDTTNMKKTLRQQIACKNRTGNVQGGNNATLHNKNLRKTRKTNVIGNSRQAGNVNKNQWRGYIKETDDIAKTTMKETTLVEDYVGNADAMENRDGGYQIKKYKFDETNRDTTSINYMGDANATGDAGGRGAYHVTKHNPKATIRQETSVSYTGTAMGEDKPQSYDSINNSTTKSIRDKIAKGRTPSTGGPQKRTGTKNIKMSTRRTGDLKNKLLNGRGMVSTKTYNSIPQIEQCGETKRKMTVPNGPIQNRLDPDMLTALESNPYTRPFAKPI